MKTHLFLKFEYEDTTWKTLISRIQLPQVVRDVKFIELADFSPSAVLFAFTCDFVTDYYTNCVENLLSVGLGGVGSKDYKAAASGNLRELTVRMRYIEPKVIYENRQKWCRAHIVIHHGSLRDSYHLKPSLHAMDMKKTSFLLKLVSDESQAKQSVTYKLPKPLFDCKYIQAINWFASGGYDYVTNPQIKTTFSNDPVLKEPVLAYGVGGVSKNTEVMELDSPGTLNELHISLVKPGGGKYGLNYSFVHLVVYHESMRDCS